jgi:hypothetical protein
LPVIYGTDHIDPERFARFAAVAERLGAARACAPTMVVIDDAHSADEGALLLTWFFAAALDRLPLVLLLARRDGAATGGALLDELARDATTVPLRRFIMHETAAILRSDRSRASGQVTAALLQVTGRDPLFLAHALQQGWPDSSSATVQHH